MGHSLALEAEADLDDIWLYIATESGSIETADRLVESITRRFFLLAMQPHMGRRRDDDLRPGVRTFPVGEYAIAYRLDGDDVRILRVLRGAGTSKRSCAISRCGRTRCLTRLRAPTSANTSDTSKASARQGRTGRSGTRSSRRRTGAIAEAPGSALRPTATALAVLGSSSVRSSAISPRSPRWNTRWRGFRSGAQSRRAHRGSVPPECRGC